MPNRIYLRKSKRPIKRLIFHHFGASVPEGMDVSQIRYMHMSPKPIGRGWDDIGYHGLIMPDGLFCLGRDVDKAGAHTWSFNTGSIGIMFVAASPVGGVTRPSKAQLDTAMRIIAEQDEYYDDYEVLGHNNLRPTHCPGFDVPHWVVTGQIIGKK